MEQAVQKTMDMNQKAMEQQGLKGQKGAPAGAGFQPPESMQERMDKQAKAAGGTGKN
ncbi:MAG: hypothetical protein HY000_34115, partial [Planctomycetes bacterium]|nr:hypothetical protein [Planctomycetota bacterium]